MNIEHIIIQRLSLQSTERKLHSFNVPANIDFINSRKFKSAFSMWDRKKQTDFAELIGGKVNKNKTLKFLFNI